ncbi:putative lipoprotein [Leptospira fainei serovar Hurstbridge str. BUT 6]|uniref:Lipoprotein n=1 Tax=Leptospira fainei serovar Hurstbridge str. BUT 6 TaxID=1193011 RepID=S3V9Q4_9LEPT|nr:putative lipoprotein [Leptospira fainei serovar Hurstbridge str. BUT 6]
MHGKAPKKPNLQVLDLNLGGNVPNNGIGSSCTQKTIVLREERIAS